jgi:DNA repair protein RecN (Recombination protein N)
MIEQLRVRALGVIADVDVSLSSGLSVITGETGAGKTLIVEALELLVGGKSDSALVRHESNEAIVEGRFVNGDAETIVVRVVPVTGRSRATIDDKMVTIGALEDFGAVQVDLYGQHVHQSLLRQTAQRAALDEFAGVDLAPIRELRQQLLDLRASLEAIGGDEGLRLREIDLLSFELDEIDTARIRDVDEDEHLAAEESRLAMAVALRSACEHAYEALEGGAESGALDLLGAAVEETGRFEALSSVSAQLRGAAGEMSDIASDLRRLAESFEEDPARLDEITERRQLLHRLVRKHGTSLADVIAVAEAARSRIAELNSSEARREELTATKARLEERLSASEIVVGDQRRAAAAALSAAVVAHMEELGLAGAELLVSVSDGPGDDVEFLLSANRGEPSLPLTKVASGGELARVMLALRLVLSSAPPTLIFDEVDAGIGGEAALVVGKALASLGRTHQVLVVTHLAQVAAFADHQFVVEKEEVAGRTVSRCSRVDGEDRVRELSRMLSGHPDSVAARRHAAELLELAVLARS